MKKLLKIVFQLVILQWVYCAFADPGTGEVLIGGEELPNGEILLFEFNEEDYEFEAFDQNFGHIQDLNSASETK